MSTATLIIVAAVFVAGLLSGFLVVWLVLRKRKPAQGAPQSPAVPQPQPAGKSATPVTAQTVQLVFRWSYVTAPLIIALVSLVVALIFVVFLPNPLAFRFNSDGSALTTMDKAVFVILMVAVQLISALVSIAIAQTIVKVSKNMFKSSEAPLQLDGFVSLMSNMILLPQVILAYLMLDAFIYGVWSIHLISFTAFAIAAVSIGSLLLIIIFMRLASSARVAINKH